MHVCKVNLGTIVAYNTNFSRVHADFISNTTNGAGEVSLVIISVVVSIVLICILVALLILALCCYSKGRKHVSGKCIRLAYIISHLGLYPR